jgi:hypothetical protein
MPLGGPFFFVWVKGEVYFVVFLVHNVLLPQYVPNSTTLYPRYIGQSRTFMWRNQCWEGTHFLYTLRVKLNKGILTCHSLGT